MTDTPFRQTENENDFSANNTFRKDFAEMYYDWNIFAHSKSCQIRFVLKLKFHLTEGGNIHIDFFFIYV